jgi:uncharacterized protein (DUF58 family)
VSAAAIAAVCSAVTIVIGSKPALAWTTGRERRKDHSSRSRQARRTLKAVAKLPDAQLDAAARTRLYESVIDSINTRR